MEGFHLKNFEVKTSKTGLSVPVVNGVHLHSVYDPLKEAQSLSEKNREVLKSSKRILIFGLGYGYHIEMIAKILKQYHRAYEVVVIEPVYEVFEGCSKLRRIKDENISIFAGHETSKLYEDIGLAEFMSQKPSIIAHPASMNLYSDYFKKFMSYEASEATNNLAKLIVNEDLRKCLNQYDQNLQYNDFIKNIKISNKPYLKSDYLVLALEEMSK